MPRRALTIAAAFLALATWVALESDSSADSRRQGFWTVVFDSKASLEERQDALAMLSKYGGEVTAGQENQLLPLLREGPRGIRFYCIRVLRHASGEASHRVLADLLLQVGEDPELRSEALGALEVRGLRRQDIEAMDRALTAVRDAGLARSIAEALLRHGVVDEQDLVGRVVQIGSDNAACALGLLLAVEDHDRCNADLLQALAALQQRGGAVGERAAAVAEKLNRSR